MSGPGGVPVAGDLEEAERLMRLFAKHGTSPAAALMVEYDRRAQEIAALRGEKPHAAAVIDRFKEQAAQIAAVRALHCLDEEMSAATGRDCCKGCATSVTHSRWPCKTIAALDAPPEVPLVSPKQSQTLPVSPREDETPEPAPADDETFKCPACGHDADHSGGRCMWIDDYLRNGEHVQEACQCTAGPTLVALCDNVDFDTGDSCTGRLRFTWGQSEAPCDTCRGRCGIAVARWERVEPPAGSVSTTPDPAADALAKLIEAAKEVAQEWNAERMGHGAMRDGPFARLGDALAECGDAAAALAGTATTPEPLSLVPAARTVLAEWARMHPSGHLAMYKAMDGLRAALDGTATPPQPAEDELRRLRLDLSAARDVVAAVRRYSLASADEGPRRERLMLAALERHDERVYAELRAEPRLIGTWADPKFRAHQDHKHPVEGCGYCPTEES